jgi:DNA-binding transcriptional regulator YdaS (Cro superfamily)
MTLADYLKDRGAQAELARAINVSPVLIHQWATGSRKIPIERCYPIEQATNRKVTRKELRDDWKGIWPELNS